MFILTAEKEQIKRELQILRANVAMLESEIIWLRGMIKGNTRQVLRTADAPYGLKKNGEPRKRPGRPPQTMEITS